MESSSKSIRCSALQYVYDIRKWLSPHIDEVHDHTIPHVFLFRRGSSGDCEMLYKNWAKDKWIRSERILKVRFYISY